jgi:hypothetical protein
MRKQQTAIAAACLLAAVSVWAQNPLVYEGDINIQAKPMDQGGRAQWDMGLKAGNTGRVRLNTYAGTNRFDATGYTVTFHAGPSRDDAGTIEVTGSATNNTTNSYVEFTFGTNDLAYPFTDWYSAVKFAAGAVIVSAPEGKVSCSGAPEVDGGSLNFTYNVNWSLYRFSNGLLYGPDIPDGSTLTATTNTRGQTVWSSVTGTSTNSALLGGQLPAYYLDYANFTGAAGATGALDAAGMSTDSERQAATNAALALARDYTNALDGLVIARGYLTAETDAAALSANINTAALQRAEWTAQMGQTSTLDRAAADAAVLAGTGTVYTLAVAAADVAAIAGLAPYTNHQTRTDNPHTTTLQQAVNAGGTVTSGVVTIDAANARTNTYGGLLGIGPGRWQAGGGLASGAYSWANYGGTASGVGSWANYGGIASGIGSWAMGVYAVASDDNSFAWSGQVSHGVGTFNIGAPSLLYLAGTNLQTLLDGKLGTDATAASIGAASNTPAGIAAAGGNTNNAGTLTGSAPLAVVTGALDQAGITDTNLFALTPVYPLTIWYAARSNDYCTFAPTGAVVFALEPAAAPSYYHLTLTGAGTVSWSNTIRMATNFVQGLTNEITIKVNAIGATPYRAVGVKDW